MFYESKSFWFKMTRFGYGDVTRLMPFPDAVLALDTDSLDIIYDRRVSRNKSHDIALLDRSKNRTEALERISVQRERFIEFYRICEENGVPVRYLDPLSPVEDLRRETEKFLRKYC